MVKNPPAQQETQVQYQVNLGQPEPRFNLGQKDPLEKGMAILSSILAWEIPWTEETDRLQSMESQKIGHDLETKPPPTRIR